MTGKQLEELGLTKEQADKIMEINGGNIENAKGNFEERIKALESKKGELSNQITSKSL